MYPRLLIGIVVLPVVALAWPGAPLQYTVADAQTRYGGPVVDVDWGRPVTSGDLDGDGYDELIVSASKAFGGVLSKVYVMRGGPTAHNRGYVDLSSAGVDQVILDAAVNENLGASMATGDVNGDGIDDLLLCASLADYAGVADRGIAYLIYGSPTFFASATRDLSTTGAWDLRILGPVAAGDMGGAIAFGGADTGAAAIGRLNNDIYGDIVLGVHLASGGGSQAGRVYVVNGGPFTSGFTLNLQQTSAYQFVVYGKYQYDELGTMVATGDITGDGLEDLILPNQYWSKGLFTTEGAVHAFRGGSLSGSHSLASSAAPITIKGGRAWDELGEAALVADFNGDGIGDLAAAAPGAELGNLNTQRGDGIVYVVLGKTAFQTGTHVIDFATAQPSWMLVGETEENLGQRLSAGDFNGDGIADLAASEWFAGPNTNGAVVVVFGRQLPAGARVTADVNSDLYILGAASDRISFSMASSNVNDDTLDEVVFGTPFNNGNRGTVYALTHVSGEADFDGDVDANDFVLFQICYGSSAGLACTTFDFNLDGTIDAADALKFEQRWTGSQ